VESAVLSLSRKLDYALIALAELAGRGRDTISARQIAEKYHVPLPMLTNILKELAAEGMVASTRGPKGGYRLARVPREILLTDLIDAIEGPLKLTLCCQGAHTDLDDAGCDLEAHCPTKAPLQKVQVMLQQFLSQVSLADLVSDTVQIRFDRAAGGATSKVTCG
jgi:Rrf2 family protein